MEPQQVNALNASSALWPAETSAVLCPVPSELNPASAGHNMRCLRTQRDETGSHLYCIFIPSSPMDTQPLTTDVQPLACLLSQAQLAPCPSVLRILLSYILILFTDLSMWLIIIYLIYFWAVEKTIMKQTNSCFRIEEMESNFGSADIAAFAVVALNFSSPIQKNETNFLVWQDLTM